MISRKKIANLVSLIGILSFSIGIFFLLGKVYLLQQASEVTKKWSDQIYAETYGSGYVHGSIEPSEKIHVSLEVEPRDIQYDMHVIKGAERDYIQVKFLFLLVIGGFIFAVMGSYLSGKLIGRGPD